MISPSFNDGSDLEFVKKLFRRLIFWFRRRRADAELAEEIEFHRALRQERLEQAGMSAADAQAESRKALGNALAAREQAQDIWGSNWLDALRQDLSYAVRQVRQAPAMTAFILLTLAIPIGAITGSMAIVNAETFTYGGERHQGVSVIANPKELKQVLWHREFRPGFFAGNGHRDLSYPVYEHLRDGTSSFSDHLCLTYPWSGSLDNVGGVEDASVMLVSGNIFRALGVIPPLGRPITPEDDVAAAPPVAIVSHGFWQRVLGGDTAAIGRALTVNGFPVVVIGVWISPFLLRISLR
jgi:hypothetical protein